MYLTRANSISKKKFFHSAAKKINSLFHIFARRYVFLGKNHVHLPVTNKGL